MKSKREKKKPRTHTQLQSHRKVLEMHFWKLGHLNIYYLQCRFIYYEPDFCLEWTFCFAIKFRHQSIYVQLNINGSVADTVLIYIWHLCEFHELKIECKPNLKQKKINSRSANIPILKREWSKEKKKKKKSK